MRPCQLQTTCQVLMEIFLEFWRNMKSQLGACSFIALADLNIIQGLEGRYKIERLVIWQGASLWPALP